MAAAYALGSLLLHGAMRDLSAVVDIAGRPELQMPAAVPGAGSVHPTAAARPRGTLLRVLSYNLNHVSRGNDDDPANVPHFPRGCSELTKLSISLPSLVLDRGRVERNIRAIAALIRRESPDVVLLQEADRGMPESLWIDTASAIAAAADLPFGIWGAKWSAHVGLPYITGNAILSRYPLRDACNTPLNAVSWRSPHRKLLGVHTALSATVQTPAGPVRIINTHLYSQKRGYAKKAEQVRTLVESVRTSPVPVIVGGDFNTSMRRLRGDAPSSGDPTLPLLDESGVVHMAGVFDAAALDYVFVRRGDPLTYVTQHMLPPVATDHRIVRTELHYRPSLPLTQFSRGRPLPMGSAAAETVHVYPERSTRCAASGVAAVALRAAPSRLRWHAAVGGLALD